MFLAMNRFRIVPGKEDDFVAHWLNSKLNQLTQYKS